MRRVTRRCDARPATSARVRQMLSLSARLSTARGHARPPRLPAARALHRLPPPFGRAGPVRRRQRRADGARRLAAHAAQAHAQDDGRLVARLAPPAARRVPRYGGQARAVARRGGRPGAQGPHARAARRVQGALREARLGRCAYCRWRARRPVADRNTTPAPLFRPPSPSPWSYAEDGAERSEWPPPPCSDRAAGLSCVHAWGVRGRHTTTTSERRRPH